MISLHVHLARIVPPALTQAGRITSLLILLAVPLSAQTALGGGGGNQSQGNAARPAEPGFIEVASSALDLLVATINEPTDNDNEDKVQWNAYKTPRHTVMTFREAMADVHNGYDEAWERALGAFGPTGATEADDGVSAGRRAAARALAEVFRRLGGVSPLHLPGEDVVENEQLRRYEVFPYGVDHEWVWDALGQAPDGHIALTRASEGQWFFSAETIAGASALNASMAAIPPQFESEVGQVFLEAVEPLRETSLWRWGIVLGLMLVGLVAAVFAHRLLSKFGQLLERRGRAFLGPFIYEGALPVGSLTFVIIFGIALSLLPLPPALAGMRLGLVNSLSLLVIAVFLFKIVDYGAFALHRLSSSRGTAYDQTAVALLRRTLRTIMFILVGIFVLQNLAGLHVGSLLAGIGIIGLGLSLAGQGIFKNALGAFNIYLNQPFLLGDWIRFDETLGVVEDVGLYATKVRRLSGELVTVPNMRFISEQVENLSERIYLCREMDIAIPYDTPRDRINTALETLQGIFADKEVSAEGRFREDERPPQISFSHFGSYFLNLRVYYWYFIGDGSTRQRDSDRGWFTYLRHCTDVNLRIKQAFDDAGISFAFPTETQILTDDPERGLNLGSYDGNGRSRDESGRRDDHDEPHDRSGRQAASRTPAHASDAED